jgi:membrane dipeptidase
MLLIDGHLDLAMNALSLHRDLTQNVRDIRKKEICMSGKGRGVSTVAFHEMHKGEVGVCLASIFARVVTNEVSEGHNTAIVSYTKGQEQMAYYQSLDKEGVIRIIKDLKTLDVHFQEWVVSRREDTPIGVIISMEGADAIISPENLRSWWNDGLRVVSLVQFGVNIYAHGTGAEGGLTSAGRDLLERIESLGMILDVTHLSDESFWEALDHFDGSIIASHNNCRALVPGDRQFSNEQIQALIRREAIIGVSLNAYMLYPGWLKGKTPNTAVSMEAVVDQMDHIRRLSRDSRNIAIGSDLDGGFGKEQCPHDLDTIADLQKISNLLKKRGYNEEYVTNIMWRNWLNLFREVWS